MEGQSATTSSAFHSGLTALHLEKELKAKKGEAVLLIQESTAANNGRF